ncbi:hypothetical protein [Methanobacterium sp.]|uniref:hypothetical protein n=1 Tax=Methanobacterium sp. TaxID=2164 RepID=UPI003C7518F0
MKFDPKKMLDDTLNQMQDTDRRSSRRSYGHESDIDDLIYTISRDVEEIRMKNRELNDRISDLDMKFNRLRDLMRNRSY